MEYIFQVINIKTNLARKEIKVLLNMDIDFNKENEIEITLFDRETKEPITFKSDVDGQNVIISMLEWPRVNHDYILGIKGIKSVTDLGLKNNLKTSVSFKSEITSFVRIVKPTHFEKLDDLFVELKEYKLSNNDEEYRGSYYIEISLDNNFINVPYKIKLEKENTVNISLRQHGQYFIRARVQETLVDSEDIIYGEWSDTISFQYGDEVEDGGDPPIIDPDDPVEEPDDEIIVEDNIFKIIDSPVVGETPLSFAFEFSLPIDDLFIEDNIVIIKKEVK